MQEQKLLPHGGDQDRAEPAAGQDEAPVGVDLGKLGVDVYPAPTRYDRAIMRRFLAEAINRADMAAATE